MKTDGVIEQKGKKMILNNYVVVLCEKGGVDVKLARINQQPDRNTARKVAERSFPGWNVKSVQVLYRADFEEDDE